jgi:hypothetical protein
MVRVRASAEKARPRQRNVKRMHRPIRLKIRDLFIFLLIIVKNGCQMDLVGCVGLNGRL